MKFKTALFLLALMLISLPALADNIVTLKIETYDWHDRTAVANTGVDIQYVDPVDGWIIADVPEKMVTGNQFLGFAATTQETKDSFPAGYEDYHDYQETVAVLEQLHADFPEVTALFSIGQTVEGRELWCLKISDNPDSEETDEGGMFIVGQHHAREILSPEVAIYYAQTLLADYAAGRPMVKALIAEREIFVIPTVNPDGAEYDRSGNSFKLWRKNRGDNDGSACKGVDLNRNYSYEWGGAGASKIKCMLTYCGAEPFSEPETQAVRDFVLAHENIQMLVSLHTYSELVLYPWSHTDAPVPDAIERETFENLGRYMAGFNGYEPGPGSSLYLTTGDTTDWAYGELGIFAFTFELSPANPFDGNFYPNASIFDKALPDNYNALLFATGMAQNPTRARTAEIWRFEGQSNCSTNELTWSSVVETDPGNWAVQVGESESGPFENAQGSVKGSFPDHSFRAEDSRIGAGTDLYYKLIWTTAGGNSQEFGPYLIANECSADDDDDVADDDDDADATDDDSASGDDDDDDGGCCG